MAERRRFPLTKRSKTGNGDSAAVNRALYSLMLAANRTIEDYSALHSIGECSCAAGVGEGIYSLGT
jgi:hypothetical protein